MALEEAHQLAHLERRPLPVVGGKSVQREDAYTQLRSRLHDAPNRFGVLSVTEGAGPLPGACPPSVAVHDDRDVQAGWHTRSSLCHRASMREKSQPSRVARMSAS